MGKIIYPETWRDLSLGPYPRADLVSYIQEIVRWNKPHSFFKKNSTSTLIDFLYDTYDIDHGVSYLDGKLVFSDEVQSFERFAAEFSRFVNDWEVSAGSLSELHEAVLPRPAIDAAGEFLAKLEERGIPVWEE